MIDALLIIEIVDGCAETVEHCAETVRINSCGGLVDFFWRARALAARARVFVTSQVLFFPNQQYEI